MTSTPGRRNLAIPREQRPVLILGAPRSGTSLLSRMLNAHPNIAIPFESHLFNQWQHRETCYGDLGNPGTQRRFVSDIAQYGVIRDWTPRPDPEAVLPRIRTPDFAGVASAIMDWWADQHGAARWGEKTPHHLLLHQRVRAAWPDALIVFMLRDPRDAILSWKYARFGARHAIPLAGAWAEYARAYLECRDAVASEDHHTVRYETLVGDPEATLRSLMAFLGEDFDPRQIEFYAGEHTRWHTDKRNADRLASPVKSDSVGKWRTGLSSKEVRQIEAIAGDAMSALGYEPATADPAIPAAEAIIGQYIEHPSSRILGILKNRQGFDYLARDLKWRAGRVIGHRES